MDCLEQMQVCSSSGANTTGGALTPVSVRGEGAKGRRGERAEEDGVGSVAVMRRRKFDRILDKSSEGGRWGGPSGFPYFRSFLYVIIRFWDQILT